MRLGADPDQLERLARAHRAGGLELDRIRVGLDRRVARLAWHGPAAPPWTMWMRNEVLSLLARTSRGLGRSASALDRHAASQRIASMAAPRHTTIWADPVGDGRWVGRVGSERASVVVALVPGVGTDSGDVAALRADAERVWGSLAVRAERSHQFGDGGSEQVAVLSWLGYDPPDTLVGGIDGRPARSASRLLATEVDRWRSQGAERVLLVGHSYGALVASGAVGLGARVDDLVMLGAPGAGIGWSAADAAAGGTAVWAAAAPADPIAWIATLGIVHGPDPVSLSRRLPTSGRGHGGYLADPVLLDALARVALPGVPAPGVPEPGVPEPGLPERSLAPRPDEPVPSPF